VNDVHLMASRRWSRRWHLKRQSIITHRRKNVRFEKPRSIRLSPTRFRRVILLHQIPIPTTIQPPLNVSVQLMPIQNVGPVEAADRMVSETNAAPDSAQHTGAAQLQQSLAGNHSRLRTALKSQRVQDGLVSWPEDDQTNARTIRSAAVLSPGEIGDYNIWPLRVG
jgi:hypothetical protein